MSITADKFEIVALAGRFEVAFDSGDVPAHLATSVAEPELESSMGVYSGAQAYVEWLKGFMAQTRAAGGTRHLITNADVTVDGDSATASFYLTVINQMTGKIMGTATFDDELIRYQSISQGCGSRARGATPRSGGAVSIGAQNRPLFIGHG